MSDPRSPSPASADRLHTARTHAVRILLDLADQGWIADEPLLGGSDAITQAGLDDEDTEGSTE